MPFPLPNPTYKTPSLSCFPFCPFPPDLTHRPGPLKAALKDTCLLTCAALCPPAYRSPLPLVLSPPPTTTPSSHSPTLSPHPQAWPPEGSSERPLPGGNLQRQCCCCPADAEQVPGHDPGECVCVFVTVTLPTLFALFHTQHTTSAFTLPSPKVSHTSPCTCKY